MLSGKRPSGGGAKPGVTLDGALLIVSGRRSGWWKAEGSAASDLFSGMSLGVNGKGIADELNGEKTLLLLDDPMSDMEGSGAPQTGCEKLAFSE